MSVGLFSAHDASPIAWFIVAAYFAGAALAFWSARLAPNGRERLFWNGCAFLLVLLGLNKQLDLQSYVTTFGRSLAENEGWFGERRRVQEVFILLLAGGAGALIVGLYVWLRRSTASVKTAAVGLTLLFVFILIRAASFHHMDVWVTTNFAGMRSGWWLELTGIAVTGLSALSYSRRNRARPGRL